MREALGKTGAGWRTPLHLREQYQRKVLQILSGDFQRFINSQPYKSFALFCELADMARSKIITLTTALEGGTAAAPKQESEREVSTPGRKIALVWWSDNSPAMAVLKELTFRSVAGHKFRCSTLFNKPRHDQINVLKYEPEQSTEKSG